MTTSARALTRDDVLERDATDPLGSLRDQFILADDIIYLDGNSLGPLSKSVPERMNRAIHDEWGVGLIRSWLGADWYPAPFRIGAKIARLIGANADEVVVCDSTSVNLFKVMMSAARMRPHRKIIVSDQGNFPTNAYITAEVAQLVGAEVVFAEQANVPAAIDAAGDQLAFVQLTEINFRSGLLYDMAAITAQVHHHGGLAIWDLCHSAGAFPVALNECDVDFAVGCTYKYLNGGPGSPAFLFVAERHVSDVHQPLPGWHGHARPFGFEHDYEPEPGIGRMLAGTAPQLSMIALEAALDAFDGVDMQAVRSKSVALTELFIQLADTQLVDMGFAVVSPRNSELRGSQVAIAHEQAYAIMQAIIACGVIGDFRAPNLLRFGFAPLYTRYVDAWDAVAVIRNVMETCAWNDPKYQVRNVVT